SGVAGETVDELHPPTRQHDERVPGLAAVVTFGPAEDIAVERPELGAPGIVERLRRHGHRHVVQPWRESLVVAHDSPDRRGRTITLPGSSPAAQRCMTGRSSSR